MRATNGDRTVRIATWNLEWAVPGTGRHDRAFAQLESIGADIVVTTEDSVHDWDAYPYRIDGGADWGYRIVEGRRKVIAWSKTPWADMATLDDGACRGRFVRGRTNVGGVEVQMLAVCIPWRDAHVRSGRRDSKVWDEHIDFCSGLASEIAPSHESGAPLTTAPHQSSSTRQTSHLARSDFAHSASLFQVLAQRVSPWPLPGGVSRVRPPARRR